MSLGNLTDFHYSRSLEWLETNGLGGFASSTVSGAHSRKYHGLLVAAMKPPVERLVLLSKLEETLICGEQQFHLSSNQYPGAIYPKGFQHLVNFDRYLFPVFTYKAGGIKLQKTIAAIQGENTTVIVYEVLSAKKSFSMELLPLCSCRDFHSICQANDAIYKGYVFENGVFRTKNYHDSPEFFIGVPESTFQPTQQWHHRIEYYMEQERGLDFHEDLFNHGKFVLPLKEGDRLGIIISTENPSTKNAFLLFDQELKRREMLIEKYSQNKSIQQLVLAADQFVVRRGHDLKTIIAGYHWFSDWGRDTMISLPGLCLVTGRFEDAKKILRAFAAMVSEGMLPNKFSDYGEAPEYNTVDATLWFFHAIHQYYHYTNDKSFVTSIIPVLKDCMDWHYKGTRYNIHVDSDELLYAGKEGVQLTWMDAKVGDWVVTPRRGKAVEINALWYNALCIMAALLKETGDFKESHNFNERAVRAKTSFNALFWNEAKECLYDFIDGNTKNDDLRPNQIFALSLPFELFNKEKGKKILNKITSRLLTSRGLRSLSHDHADYKPYYNGDRWHRDAAYHQGTVWSFLLGPYVDAIIKLKGTEGKTEAANIVRNFLHHLNEACVGSVSEIFDAESPHYPKGCVAQAWGVGEILRVSLEYNLFSE
jgi:predicted glycogen debranching enzyme